jgi:hypothetical protein
MFVFVGQLSESGFYSIIHTRKSQKEFGLNISGKPIILANTSRSFPQSIQAKAWILSPLNRNHFLPRPF